MEELRIKDEIILSSQEKEIYRTLRTNVEFTGVENRVIAITSCIPGDGKTMVSYNLAVALAEAGKKTVLVDADLRKSVLLRRLDISQTFEGLSHLLSGHAEMKNVIYNTDIENLYIIPAGIRPSNSPELLGNERFKLLIHTLDKNYDYVIIDTPPLGSVIDAAIIAKECHASILVISSDRLSRSEACNIVEQLRTANSNILGAVINKTNHGEKHYSYDKYSGTSD